MRHPDLAMWRLMSPLLDRALDIDRDERNALLAELRTAQPDVATALEEALHEHDRLARAGFLETPPATHPAVPPPLAGTLVGAYTLEKRLGAGGMGSVWLARRSDGRFEGAVAVKLLHVAVLDAGGAQRFTREGSFLARLSHPHIARLLDAGVTEAGQPYLVLEHVEGVRIDEYADSRTLDLRARLDLFLQVADAVSHAHAHLIVHRDLKPGNILVDEHGQVKLLDFGIAKLVDGSGADDTVIGRAWTPAYAAPEQVRDEPVTVATDVYALGVLLYDLLVEAHPTGTGCTTPAEFARALVEHDPIAPSVGLAAHPTAASVAVHRGTTRQALLRSLHGDLDNIVVKALQKAPERRYASAAAFAEDIGRYLRDEPVVARPDRWGYRAGKFIRRHRVSVAAAAAVLLMLTTTTVVTANLMFEARRQRDVAAEKARQAQASAEFMRNLVTQIGPTPMTMKQVLDLGRQALERQHDDPAFVARMLTLLSAPYVELGDYATASTMVTRALEIAVQIDDAELIAGSRCLKARQEIEDRAFPSAHEHLAEARRQLGRLSAPPTNLLVECAIADSELADGEERFDAAIDHAKIAVTMLERDGNRRARAIRAHSTIWRSSTVTPAASRTRRRCSVRSWRSRGASAMVVPCRWPSSSTTTPCRSAGLAGGWRRSAAFARRSSSRAASSRQDACPRRGCRTTDGCSWPWAGDRRARSGCCRRSSRPMRHRGSSMPPVWRWHRCSWTKAISRRRARASPAPSATSARRRRPSVWR